MSTRYVWGKYNVETDYDVTISSTATSTGASNPRAYSGYEIKDGKLYGIGSGVAVTSRGVSVNSYHCLFPYGSPDTYMYTGPTYSSAFIWRLTGGDVVLTNVNNLSSRDTFYRNTIVNNGDNKGSLQGYVSSASNGQYPDDNVSGNVWYTKQGSDNIDPSVCSIPSTILGGKEIQINVTPGTGKVYEGTVSYLYQVKLGDDEWTTIATTSATSQKYTVPYGTSTFQVRVRAQDNLGFTSTDYVTSSSVTVINNQPPTAPGSIEVTNVIKGQTATITITAATDPDGTVESYIYERSIDGSAFTQIANVNALSQTDQVSADWGTVAYRVCAVDDDGGNGPYVTSETTTVNSGWIIISGPAADMGDKPAPFNFIFTPNVTGQTGVTDISVVVTLDGEEIYNDTPDAGQEVSIPIDTRLMIVGEHNIQIAATKTDFLEANGNYKFNIPAIALPDGGIAEILQNSEGETIFPYTLARLVIGKDGKDLNELLDGLLKNAAKIYKTSYVGTGTYGSSGSGTRTSVTFPFEPKFVLFGDRTFYTIYIWGQTGLRSTNSSYGLDAYISGNTLSWVCDTGNTAAVQMNTKNQTYIVFAIA